MTRLVPWDLCPDCGGEDGSHTTKCEARSLCITVGCGRMIETHAEMAEDGLCHRCTEAFIVASNEREAAAAVRRAAYIVTLFDIKYGFARVRRDGVVIGHVCKRDLCGAWYSYAEDDERDPVYADRVLTRWEAVERLIEWLDEQADAP